MASLNPSQLGSLFKIGYAVGSWEAPLFRGSPRPVAVTGSLMHNQIYRRQATLGSCRALCAPVGRKRLATGREFAHRVMLLIQVKSAGGRTA